MNRLRREQLEYMIEHILFPIKLPSINEELRAVGEHYIFLHFVYETMREMQGESKEFLRDSQGYRSVCDMIKSWCDLQYRTSGSSQIRAQNVHEAIRSLQEDDYMALHMGPQNACLLIAKSADQASERETKAIISYFQPSLSSAQVMSHGNSLHTTVPHTSVRVASLETLESFCFAEHLADLSNGVATVPANSTKAGKVQNEVRDSASPALVSEWLLSHLVVNEGLSSCSWPMPVRKKVRDDVIRSNGLLPFRRSPIWTSVKSVLHLYLLNRLDQHMGLVIYKLVMIRVLDKLCACSFKANSDDLNVQMTRKLARRLDKLSKLVERVKCDAKLRKALKKLIQAVIKKCSDTIHDVERHLKSKSTQSDVVASTLLDPDLISVQDRFHTGLGRLHAEAVRISRLTLDAKEASALRLTSWPRNPLTAGTSCFPRLDRLSASPRSLYDVEMWLVDAFTYRRHMGAASFTFADLFALYEAYMPLAESAYAHNPLGFSRMALVHITVVCALDDMAAVKTPMLLEYRLGIESHLIESLLLPEHKLHSFALKLHRHITNRNANCRFNTSICDDVIDCNCFGARFAFDSEACQKLKSKIVIEAECKRRAKIDELESARKKHASLVEESHKMSCQFDESGHDQSRSHKSTCRRCQLLKEAENSKVKVHEWPLPKSDHQCNAVMFELLIPEHLAVIRDSLFLLRTRLLSLHTPSGEDKQRHHQQQQGFGTWLDYHELARHALNKQKHVTLVSSTKLFVNAHYSSKHVNVSKEKFLVPNGYTTTFGNKSRTIISWHQEERSMASGYFEPTCTFRMWPPYHALQWSVNNTRHTVNEIKSELHTCPAELRLAEFERFACVRAGHRLQMLNVLDVLQSRGLAFEHSSVTLLIVQASCQIGPVGGLGDLMSPAHPQQMLYSAAQTQFANVAYLRTLLATLLELARSIEKKWSDHCVLYMLVMLAHRAVSLMPTNEHTMALLGEYVALLRTLRRVGLEWQTALTALLKKRQATTSASAASVSLDLDTLNNKLTAICAFTLLTYDIDERFGAKATTMRNGDDVSAWLLSASRLHKQRGDCWPPTSQADSYFMAIVLDQVDLCTLRLESAYKQAVGESDCACLTLFVEQVWSVLKRAGHNHLDKWSLHTGLAQDSPVWHRTIFHRTNKKERQTSATQIGNVTLHVSMSGEFLVNGMPVSRLPNYILEHSVYQRFFGAANFDVHSSELGLGAFAFDYKFSSGSIDDNNNNGSVANRFTLYCNGADLVVKEERADERSARYLLPQSLFVDKFPFQLVNSFSYWLTTASDSDTEPEERHCIEFWPRFYTEYMRDDAVCSYRLDLANKTLSECSGQRRQLVDVNSDTFKEIAAKCTDLLDERPFVHMFVDEHERIAIHLTRLGLRFHVEEEKAVKTWRKLKRKLRIMSGEYGMQVSDEQRLDTLVGLRRCLLLCDLDCSGVKHPSRILLVPNGPLRISSESANNVQEVEEQGIEEKRVDIEHDSARSPAVFAYEYQPVLRRLKAANSIEACLFLALLHAATARPLADTFTGVTGTEMALHLLPPNSSSTWSCKPLSDTSKFMLRELASLSPLRTFYPPHLQVMQQVSWPKAMSESNAHEAFHFIAKSLLADSERLLFAYPGFKKSQLSESTSSTSEFLSRRAYTRSCKLYRPSERADYAFESTGAMIGEQKPQLAFEPYKPSKVTQSIRFLAATCEKWHWCEERADLFEIVYSPKSKLEWKRAAEKRKPTFLSNMSTYSEQATNEGLRLHWLLFYKYALDARADPERLIRLKMALTYFAFKGVPLPHLVFFFVLAHHSQRFRLISVIDPIDFDHLEYGYEYEPKQLEGVIRSCFVSEQTYYFEVLKKSEPMYRQYPRQAEYSEAYYSVCEQFTREKATELERLMRILNTLNWYTDRSKITHEALFLNNKNNNKTGLFGVSASCEERVVERLRKRFEVWIANEQLVEFLSKVQQVYDSIKCAEELEFADLSAHPLPLARPADNGESYRLEFDLRLRLDDDQERLLGDATRLFQTGQLCTDFNNNNINTECKKDTDSLAEAMDDLPCFPITQREPKCKLSLTYHNDFEKSWRQHHSDAKRRTPGAMMTMNDVDEQEAAWSVAIDDLWSLVDCVFGEKSSPLNRCLIESGLWPRSTPLYLIKYLLEALGVVHVANGGEQHRQGQVNAQPFVDILGAICVCWSSHGQLIRCMRLKKRDDAFNLSKELSNKPHSNWSPKQYPQWLVLQLELDIIIREIQVRVAECMIAGAQSDEKTSGNMMMQLNMGEGKTSVIMPMVISRLADGSQLARTIVLDSLFQMNYTSLVHCMGGLLNKRIYVLPFRREILVTSDDLTTISDLLDECMRHKHIVLTKPEYCLSLKLKSIEMCGVESSTNNSVVGQQLLDIYRFYERHARDIMDESDEILSVKYQLVYSGGRASSLNGNSLRWQVAQDVLALASKHLATLKGAQEYADSIEYTASVASGPQAFPLVRLLDKRPYKELCKRVCDDFLHKKLGNAMRTPMAFLTDEEVAVFSEFVLANRVEKNAKAHECLHNNTKSESGQLTNQVVFILRGLLTYEVLYVVLSKRWKVEYGVNTIPAKNEVKRRLLQAVPFRAKDVPAQAAQFAHADIMIALTQLSYYYSGLSDEQLDQLFQSLAKESSPKDVYKHWITNMEAQCPHLRLDSTIRRYESLNLADSCQKHELLYPQLRMAPLVIDYWLDRFVYAREAKECQHRLSTSAWDLCSLSSNATTGFSGTNDSRLLLPTNVSYEELDELRGTSGRVLAHLLEQSRGRKCYEALVGVGNESGQDIRDNEERILECALRNRCSVLLDVGALVLKLDNKQLVVKWLSTPGAQQFEAGVYVENDELWVWERASGIVTPFETSIYKQQQAQKLDKCLIYLDEIHTRGIDLRIPDGARALVTLGRGVSKDRLVQACMRMRRLGIGHYVNFLASHEVHNAILASMRDKQKSQRPIECIDVVEWSIENSLSQIAEGFIYWAEQGLVHCRKKRAWNTFEQDKNKANYFEACREDYGLSVRDLYGNSRVKMELAEIVTSKKTSLGQSLPLEFDQLIERIRDLVPHKRKHAQLLQEEIELEIECEKEEQVQVERPPPALACEHQLDADVVALCVQGHFAADSESFMTLGKSLANSSLGVERAWNSAWSPLIQVTRDFSQTVVSKQACHSSDDYLASPRWLVHVANVDPERISLLVISDFEANSLLPHFTSANPNRLFLFSPRLHSEQRQRLFAHDMQLNVIDVLPDTLVEELALFAGSLYFTEESELHAYLSLIAYCPRTPHLQRFFNEKLIENNGFVKPAHREAVFGTERANESRYDSDPSECLDKLLSIRHFGIVPSSSHQLVVLKRGERPTISLLN